MECGRLTTPSLVSFYDNDSRGQGLLSGAEPGEEVGQSESDAAASTSDLPLRCDCLYLSKLLFLFFMASALVVVVVVVAVIVTLLFPLLSLLGVFLHCSTTETPGGAIR